MVYVAYYAAKCVCGFLWKPCDCSYYEERLEKIEKEQAWCNTIQKASSQDMKNLEKRLKVK